MIVHPTPIRLTHHNNAIIKKRKREIIRNAPAKRHRSSPMSTTIQLIPFHPVLQLSYWSWMYFHQSNQWSVKDEIIQPTKQQPPMPDDEFIHPCGINSMATARVTRMPHLISQVASYLSLDETLRWSCTSHSMSTWYNKFYLPTLQHLVCTRIPPTNILIQTPHIQSLQLREAACDINDTHMMAILSHRIPKSLVHVNLNRCTRLTDASLRLLAQRVPRMTVLSLNGCDHISDHGMTYLASYCRSLTCLSLAGCRQLTGQAFIPLIKCKQLRVLNASGMVQLTDADMVVTQYWQSLRHLSISQCPRLTVATLLQLVATVPDLITLDVSDLPQIQNANLRMLAGFPQLATVSLRGTNTTHEGWTYLQYIKPNLRIFTH